MMATPTPQPIEQAMTITPARQEDLDAIVALERSAVAEAEQWSRRSWQGELLGERRSVLLARADQVLGVICLQTVDRGADLQRLLVAPRAQGRGVGSALVRAGIETVRRLGARTVMLEVRYDNEPAIALYQRLGFEQLAVREHYYGPQQHALILKRYDLQNGAAEGSR